MTWGSFVDFWIMREMGHEDAIMRNYDIMRFVGSGELRLSLALSRIGIPHRSDEALNYVPEVCGRLTAMGQPAASVPQVRTRLIGWYEWDRIRRGDIRSWFLSEMVHSARGGRNA